ncbi:M48 family metallopeptidase [Nitrosomonas sp. ANs5]|uniref:M48 family metallopeptidase n=1 Tax=Nitrosomonas sp. ANs5 TaxID=3423941 RepID=UPI003D33EB15
MNSAEQIVVSHLNVNGMVVAVVRKPIKHMYLYLDPPDGRVRAVVPSIVSDEAIRLMVIGKLAWVERRQAAFTARPAVPAQAMIDGEHHHFLGQCYALRVHEQTLRHGVVLRKPDQLELYVWPGAGSEQRKLVLSHWYRAQLQALIPSLLAKWQAVVGVRVVEWRIKRMRTRWGSCNPAARRIWLSLELAKKSIACIEYVLVHELVHLHERRHNQRFKTLMSHYLPDWRQRHTLLNQSVWNESYRP